MDLIFMKKAFDEAKKASASGEVPVGAVLARNGKIIAKSGNKREASNNPFKHAEMVLLEKAGKKNRNWRLNNTTLYVTVEPCPMCLGALLQARIGRLVYGCTDPKRKAVKSADASFAFPTLDRIKKITGNNHTISITGKIMENECRELLKNFFREKRRRQVSVKTPFRFQCSLNVPPSGRMVSR